VHKASRPWVQPHTGNLKITRIGSTKRSWKQDEQAQVYVLHTHIYPSLTAFCSTKNVIVLTKVCYAQEIGGDSHHGESARRFVSNLGTVPQSACRRINDIVSISLHVFMGYNDNSRFHCIANSTPLLPA